MNASTQTQSATLPTPAVDVHLVGGTPKTSSLNIAEVFGKQHKNIIRDIQNLDCSEEFNRLNFEPVEYIDEKGEARPMYELTKDGAAFLIMGFTGRNAARFKEAYIAEFNRLERQAWGGMEVPVGPTQAEAWEMWRKEKGLADRYRKEVVELRFEMLDLYRRLFGPKH